MKFIDFFAGIGGFRIGMEMAGHECVGHCEIDKYADMSYRMMHTVTEEQRQELMGMSLKDRQKEIGKEKYLNGEWYADDIRRVEPGDLPKSDCYCFGFPCQSFSIAGHRRGFEDTRGTLFFEVMRLAKERHPEYLFAENVSGLLNHDGGGTFETIIRTMDELGYSVEWQVLNSKYYVPQNRERVFIIGHLGELSGREIFPITAYSEPFNELQGQQDRIIANTIAAGDRVQVGVYPIESGGGAQSKRLSQGLIYETDTDNDGDNSDRQYSRE